MALQEAKGSKLHPSFDLLFRHTDGLSGRPIRERPAHKYILPPTSALYIYVYVPLEPSLFLPFNDYAPFTL